MNDELNKRSRAGWQTAVTLWASGVLTGVSYCSATTAAHVGDESSKTLFIISAFFFALGCLVGLWFIIERLERVD
ncbi:hypothetical protein BH09VER1_BH09VER1_17870 [soil metagenome]